MKNVTLIALGIGSLVIIYSIMSGSQVKKVDIGEQTSIEFFPTQPSKQPRSEPNIYNSDNNHSYEDSSFDKMMERTKSYINCLNKQGSGCYQSP